MRWATEGWWASAGWREEDGGLGNSLGKCRGVRWSAALPVNVSGRLGQDSWGCVAVLMAGGPWHRLLAPALRPGSPESLLTESWAHPTASRPAPNQPDSWHPPGSAHPPTELKPQGLHDHGSCYHPHRILALPTASHIRALPQAFAHTVLSACDVFWLPTDTRLK